MNFLSRVALGARARELFSVEAAAEEELRTLRGLQGGTLRVGASTTIASYMLPPMLARFAAEHSAAEHSAVTLRVFSANTRDIARRLLERRLDVALVEGVSHPRIECRPWRTDSLVMIAAQTPPFLAAAVWLRRRSRPNA